MEYEQNRDVGSRIRKLESSISSLEADLEKIQKRKSELKELTEKATNEVDNWKKEMGGILILSLQKSDGLDSMLWYSIISAIVSSQCDDIIHSRHQHDPVIVHCRCMSLLRQYW